ncbi:hypothetical protein [Amycolatopsis sp. CA-230715]|uniref:hypothetical protein n=1 Tax=Amycolatopsis sp. CA-230715 TaxID=2745196 RepID=UPI0020B2FCBA|nr:hypothetical protein [Amycolatopsis sp. CA-230715]
MSRFAAVAALVLVAVLLVLRYVPAQPPTATGPVLRELRVFSGRDVQLAIAMTALGNVGVLAVFTFISPLLTDFSGFSAGSVPARCSSSSCSACSPSRSSPVCRPAC